MSTALFPTTECKETWLPQVEPEAGPSPDLPSPDVAAYRPTESDLENGSSMADIARARAQGLGVRQAAKRFQEVVHRLESQGMNLYRRTLLDPSNARARVHYHREDHAREMIMLASNNHLGLASHPRVVRAAQQAAEQYGTGSGSAPLLVGTFPITRRLESQLADLKHSEETCVFASGYQTNVGVISSLVTKNDLVVLDQLGHASMWDGANMSDAKVRSFRHNDPEHLDRILTRNRQAGTKLVCVEASTAWMAIRLRFKRFARSPIDTTHSCCWMKRIRLACSACAVVEPLNILESRIRSTSM